MILRNGLLSTLRSKGRTALFTLLLLILTVTLSLGLGMWAYCAAVLSDMDASYTSIALMEYMGTDYPDADAGDEYARQASAALDRAALSMAGGVKLWENLDASLILLDGYERLEGFIPYEDYGVVVASSLSPYYQQGLRVVSEDELPEARAEYNTATGFLTYYMPGLEPLEVPYYTYEEGIGYYYYEYDPSDSSTHQVYVSESELPGLYQLVNTDKQLITVGSIPAEYRRLPTWHYDPSTDSYQGYGDILAGYTGMAFSVYTKEGKSSFLAVFELDNTDFQPEYGKRYLLHGKFVESDSANRRFAVTDFYEGCETPPYLELSGTNDPALTESMFADYAGYYRLANNYAQVEASADVASLEVFQQGTLYLDKGRFPKPGEAGVCVISGATAARLNVGLGDTVSVSLLSSDPSDKYDLSETADSRTWEIVGVTNFLSSYEGRLWTSDAEGGFTTPLFGYTLGRAVLDNAEARNAADTLQAMVPDGVRVTLYDQGYTAAAQPLETMRTTAMAVTIASALGALVVLILFAYLFVGRQNETVGILISLGTPGGKIRLWLLSGGAAIAAAASLTGALIGGAALGRVIRAALSAAQAMYAVDTRYSEAAIGLIRDAQLVIPTPLWPAVAAGALVFLTALLLCLAFLRQARSQSSPKKGKMTVRVPKGGTSIAGRGAPRFAVLSVMRGGWRSAVVPAASLVLVLLIGILAASTQGWDQQMDSLYAESKLQGKVVSTNGRNYTNLLVSTEATQTLWQSGLLEELSVSTGWHYWLSGEMPAFASTSFGEETRAAWIASQPEIVAANDLSAAAEFYYSGAPDVEWLDGWDESFLTDAEYPSFLRWLIFFSGSRTFGGQQLPIYPALVSTRFLETHNLALGDPFTVVFSFDCTYPNLYGRRTKTYDIGVTLQAVGSFVSAGSGDNLYVPLSFWMDPAWLTGDGIQLTDSSSIREINSEETRDCWFYSNTKFNTCRFTLASAHDLESFRNFLAANHFSQVGVIARNRTTVLLQDQSFSESVGGLSRYIAFSKLLFPVLLVLVALLGFVISWLMINGRRMEFAIMRGLGASRRRVFASFFLEQAALCILGCLLGALALTAFQPEAAVWLAAAGFLACYFAGCALSVLAVGRTKLMSLLSERE